MKAFHLSADPVIPVSSCYHRSITDPSTAGFLTYLTGGKNYQKLGLDHRFVHFGNKNKNIK